MSNGLLAKVHIAKKQLGLDDDLYRETLKAVTGHSSARDCSEAQLETLIKHFSKAGFKPKGKTFTGPSTKYAAKIHALWISGWNLGVIRDNSDAAMEAFILRQTSISKAQWLKDPKDAAKVIDALKAWLERDGGVVWTVKDAGGKKTKVDPKQAIIDSQAVICWANGIDIGDINGMTLIDIQKHLGKRIRKNDALDGGV